MINTCKYRLLIQKSTSPDTVLCSYYSKKVSTNNGLHIAHYPECCGENCPIAHTNLIEDAKNKKWDGKEWI